MGREHRIPLRRIIGIPWDFKSLLGFPVKRLWTTAAGVNRPLKPTALFKSTFVAGSLAFSANDGQAAQAEQ